MRHKQDVRQLLRVERGLEAQHERPAFRVADFVRLYRISSHKKSRIVTRASKGDKKLTSIKRGKK